MKCALLLVLTTFFLLPCAQELFAQGSYLVPNSNRYQPTTNPAPGVITSLVTKGDSVLERRTIDPNEEVRVIVQFQSPPLSALHRMQGMQRSNGAVFSAAQGQVESDHARFQVDLLRLEGSVQGAPTTSGILKAAKNRVSGEYRKVYNGVALRSRRWLVDRLRTMPYVKSVSPDRQVHTLDAISNHQIGADSVWAQCGLTGSGVRIGVLDTGIDYMHPDLGAGFGPGFKVAGGWDFVNKDADPADDNGHGTHVAGIAAADGLTQKGVAPKATLFAYKVLDSHGDGYDSDVIAALERAVDPDDNPLTDDHLDIVNLSLGYGGDPTDPLSQAVDNATVAGVLCVAAAGNSGGSQTIGSPGCAAGALTVGACDGYDAVASFSSRGPTSMAYTIKPDLVAPGVSVTSTIPGGTYQALSGTSMAAPHVAGAAALIKQLHPDWFPEMLKAALMGASKDLGQDLWSQGKGRIHVLKAIRSDVLAAPQTLSFGLDYMNVSHWSQVDTVTLYNISDSALTFVVILPSSLPMGITITTDAASLTIPAHQMRRLQVALEIDNSLVQVPQEPVQDVQGVLTISGGQCAMTVPWAVIIASYIDLQMTADEASSPDAACTRLSDGRSIGSGSFTFTGGVWHLRKILPPGTYEVIARTNSWLKGQAWLIRDSVRVNPTASLVLSESEATYQVGPSLKNETGALIDSTVPLFWCTRLCSKRTGVALQLTVDGATMQHGPVLDRLCPVSRNYVFDYYYTTRPDLAKVYSYAGQASPIASDIVRDIKLGDLTRRDVEYRTHGGQQDTLKAEGAVFLSSEAVGVGWRALNPYPTGLARPFHQEWYSLGYPTGNFPWNGILLNHQMWFDAQRPLPIDPQANPYRLFIPDQAPGADGVLRSSLLLSNSPVQESRGKKVVYGMGPRHYFGRMENSNTVLRLRTNTTRGMFALLPDYTQEAFLPLFLNQSMDFEPVRLSVFLRDSTGKVIDQGTSLDRSFLDLWPSGRDESLMENLPRPGRYTLQLWDPSSYILSLKGASMVYLSVDTRFADRNPPAMTSFNIFGPDSEYTDMLPPGNLGKVEFRVSDAETQLHSVNLFYHTDSARVWVSLPLTNLEGDLYRGQLPAFALRDGFVSLRVLATDVSGNAMDYQAEPALHIGPDYTYANRAPVKPQLMTPIPGGTLQLYDTGVPTVFSWQSALDYDGWDTLSYTFHIRGSGLGTAGDRWLRDTTVTLWLMGYLAPDELYRWWVETSDGHVVVASDTATFRTSSTILSAPGAERDLPKQFSLAQNYPNPFNPATTIGYELPKESRVLLKVYNLLGQEVMTLVDREEPAGRYRITVDGRGLASGVYIYRLQAVSSASSAGKGEGSFTAARKFLLLR